MPLSAHDRTDKADAAGDIESRVHAAISHALLEGRLRPGTALRERKLAEIFKCTRGTVRKVLLRLGNEGKLELLLNRGAFVPQPSVEDIRAVYEARSAIEAGILALLGRRPERIDIARLRRHVQAEHDAWEAEAREESVRLAGEFHLQLLDMLGNAELRLVLEQLISRTRLFVALYEPHSATHCAPDEHRVITDALARGDIQQATGAMLNHLEEVQARVFRRIGPSQDTELEGVFGSY
jgi:DNA-binding GntR family transcriptional regulator